MKSLVQSQNLKTLEPWQKVMSETLQTCKFIQKWNGSVRNPRKAHRNWKHWAIVNLISELGHLEILPKLDTNDDMVKHEVPWVLDTALCHGLEGIISFQKHINNLLLHAVLALRKHLLKTQVAGPLQTVILFHAAVHCTRWSEPYKSTLTSCTPHSLCGPSMVATNIWKMSQT